MTALVVALWEFKSVFYAVWSPFVWLVGYNDPRKPSDDLLHGSPPLSAPSVLGNRLLETSDIHTSPGGPAGT